jgi:hypothetical protein
MGSRNLSKTVEKSSSSPRAAGVRLRSNLVAIIHTYYSPQQPTMKFFIVTSAASILLNAVPGVFSMKVSSRRC